MLLWLVMVAWWHGYLSRNEKAVIPVELDGFTEEEVILIRRIAERKEYA